ncbi:DNA-binding protein Ets97D-like [Adelges cooleyi]|uniref:DNA-binding protein Ets97D-like n=1 Tax=Adelges cooleyi TaxID=133065 RepID=UPI00217F7FF4|nr:DNA-binding protein Ets97D-like [Adelges cooleyi]XP_050440601.1 DNA-binding protein Ets97D-like [Adelges cooleyi]XP_050440602.1 DNA-binding protein Ets97D-like [Adelges cooleyi]
MTLIEWHETVFVIGDQIVSATFNSENCKVFDKNGFQWIVDKQFSRFFGVFKDPREWNQEEVSIWIKWIINEYKLDNLNISKFKIDGKQLTSDDFRWNDIYIEDKSAVDDFWIHLCLLKTMHNVYTKLKDDERIDVPILLKYKNSINFNQCNEIWQFLLNLLTDSNYQTVIEWIDDLGTFKILKPKTISIMWGLMKNNCTMDYAKMASAMRYHYGKGVLNRAKGKYVYKFDADIKNMVGHSPLEIKNMFK